ncbi:hypothetical protein K504DRAFT_534568 [Pleomassaria siparia CBS 279.74]|uniref:Uncharacterized protein n=1 Tax=Pleomassaria siparia CBS 279.74 TaxID=1314801 RepID=A0A6G1K811_9PLEO|nr:hypothetical protein K504DRAFT_534568 [Pleomassaria siparia CBS 279.74]
MAYRRTVFLVCRPHSLLHSLARGGELEQVDRAQSLNDFPTRLKLRNSNTLSTRKYTTSALARSTIAHSFPDLILHSREHNTNKHLNHFTMSSFSNESKYQQPAGTNESSTAIHSSPLPQPRIMVTPSSPLPTRPTMEPFTSSPPQMRQRDDNSPHLLATVMQRSPSNRNLTPINAGIHKAFVEQAQRDPNSPPVGMYAVTASSPLSFTPPSSQLRSPRSSPRAGSVLQTRGAPPNFRMPPTGYFSATPTSQRLLALRIKDRKKTFGSQPYGDEGDSDMEPPQHAPSSPLASRAKGTALQSTPNVQIAQSQMTAAITARMAASSAAADAARRKRKRVAEENAVVWKAFQAAKKLEKEKEDEERECKRAKVGLETKEYMGEKKNRSKKSLVMIFGNDGWNKDGYKVKGGTNVRRASAGRKQDDRNRKRNGRAKRMRALLKQETEFEWE